MSWDFDDLDHPDDSPRPTLCVDEDRYPGPGWMGGFEVKVCVEGHEIRGENLLTIRRKTGVEYRCRSCHNRRQRDYDRKRKAKG